MKKLFFSFLGTALFLAAQINTVSAAEILNKSEIFIGVEKQYSENLYVGAVKTIIEGDFSEDLFVIGGEVKVTGDILGDIFILGGQIDFSGKVDGDLRIIGGDVTVSGEVVGDVFAIGGDVKILPTAIINKEIFAVGGSVKLENNSPAEIKIVGGKVFVGGELSGDSEITTQNLSVGENSKIIGTLSYYAPHKISELENRVIGTLKYNEITTIRDANFTKKILLSFISFWFLLKFITNLILAFILIYMFKVFSQEVSLINRNSFWKSLLIGLLIIFISPLVVLISFVSLVALPIGFLYLIGLIFIIVISPAISAIFIGNLLSRRFGDDKEAGVSFRSAALGVVAITAIRFIPIIGGWITPLLSIVSFGSICRYIRAKIIK